MTTNNKRHEKQAGIASPLSERIEKYLSDYAAVASAAGASLLALVAPVEAKVIYTPANTPIQPGAVLSIDLNHDGTDDFSLLLSHGPGFSRSALTVLQVFDSKANNRILGPWNHVLVVDAAKGFQFLERRVCLSFTGGL